MSPLPDDDVDYEDFDDDDFDDDGDDDDEEEEEIHFREQSLHLKRQREKNSYRITPLVCRDCVMRNCCPGEW